MAPKNALIDYKLEELQAWRAEVKADIAAIRINDLAELQRKVDAMDKKNDKGFADLNLNLKGINDFIKFYKENDAPRIDRLEQSMVGGIILFALTLAGLVWNIVWGHTKPGV